MAISKQKRIPHDIAPGSPLGDSLSFSGLLSVQDHYSVGRNPQLRPKRTAQVHRQGTEFEFSLSTQQDSLTDSSASIASVEFLFSNGQFQTKATAASDHPDQLQRSAKESSNWKPRSKANESNLDNKHTTRAANNGGSDKTNRKRSSSRPWFQSFVAPCKDCRAQEPRMSVNDQVHRGRRTQ